MSNDVSLFIGLLMILSMERGEKEEGQSGDFFKGKGGCTNILFLYTSKLGD